MTGEDNGTNFGTKILSLILAVPAVLGGTDLGKGGFIGKRRQWWASHSLVSCGAVE
jgi:hypothetical protein